MTCRHPLRVVHDGLVSDVRCGQCMPCRIRRKQAWLGRLLLEHKQHGVGRFITLTYEDAPAELDYADFQDFMKRYRHHYGECRYFAVGEYGKKSGRGHWHAIVFGHEFEGKYIWKDNKAWNKGYSYDGQAETASIGYVAGYCTKELIGRRSITKMSLRPGIGFDTISKLAMTTASKNIQMYSWPSKLRINGRNYPIAEGMLEKFKEVYFNAGGLPPVLQTPEERHMLAVNVPFGTRIEEGRRSYRWLMDQKGVHGRVQKTSKDKV